MQDAEDSVMSTLILAYWCACVVHVGGPLPRPSVCVSVPADETLRQVLQRVVVSGGNRALHWRRDTDTPVVREMVSGTVLVIDQTACASVPENKYEALVAPIQRRRRRCARILSE